MVGSHLSAVLAALAWACLVAGYVVGMQQSCLQGADDDVAIAAIGLLLLGAVLAYAAAVALIWPIRRGGDMPIMVGAAVAAPLSAPYLGLGLVLPIVIGLAYGLARVVTVEGPARPRFMSIYVAGAAWYVAAAFVFFRVAFHCGLW